FYRNISMVATITLNPLLDKTLNIASLQRGTIHRASAMEIIAGGKGNNVARQLTCFGIPTTATGFIGGETGAALARILSEEKIAHDFVQTKSPTREGITYREADGTATAVFDPPPEILPEEAERLVEHCKEYIPKNSWIVCAGSSPSSSADDVFREIISEANRRGVCSVLDSYGRVFSSALDAVPTLVKMNKQEFEQAFGVTLNDDLGFQKGLQTLLDRSVQYTVITNGAAAAYAAIKEHFWKITPPEIHAVNPVGSGDAMTAGILYGFLQGWKFERCLVWGAAAGTANAQVWKVAKASIEEVQRLSERVVVKRLKRI
ncbi:MAG: 1-phosphofructokinase family hexose kinase, partial [Bacteroidota bacterium]|nr:1-phosphofructokinase family hexose kinase [Bacteroidota bacterium]